MNQQFVIENSGVNASSCEFLEHLIISLEQNINLIIDEIFEPLLYIMKHAVESQDFVQEV